MLLCAIVIALQIHFYIEKPKSHWPILKRRPHSPKSKTEQRMGKKCTRNVIKSDNINCLHSTMGGMEWRKENDKIWEDWIENMRQVIIISPLNYARMWNGMDAGSGCCCCCYCSRVWHKWRATWGHQNFDQIYYIVFILVEMWSSLSLSLSISFYLPAELILLSSQCNQ